VAVVHDSGVTSAYNDPEDSGSDFVGLTVDEAQSLAKRRSRPSAA
jgi:hypothetical protein